jgi:hypothetical protein
MTESLALNTIEKLGRAILAQLSPMCGVRSTGTVTVTADAGADKVLQPNTYLVPVIGGQERSDLVFKVTRNPATVNANGTGGAWTISGGATGSVAITSNVGGARHNLADGTTLRFSPEVEGFVATATLDAAMVDGADTGQLVKEVAFFEDLDAANPSKDIFASLLARFPALMLAWQSTEPAEGTTAGLRQGSTRGARRVRFMRETFSLYAISGRLEGDTKRRQEGLLILQAATRLLTDRQCNDDGEALSSVGAGVEIVNRDRLARGAKHYIYFLSLRVNQTLQPIDSRTFNTWITSAIAQALPGGEAPEPTGDLTVVDVEVDMTDDP